MPPVISVSMNSSRASYVDFIRATKPAVDYVHQQDDGFYRMEKTFYRMSNDNMALNMRGVSGSTSTLNQKTLTFLHRMGYRALSYISWYYGGNPVNDSLLGLKYIIDDERQLSAEFYELLYKDEVNKRFVFENPYALSMAFAADEKILGMNPTIYSNPFEFMNALLSAAVGRNSEVFSPFDVTLAGEDYEVSFPIDDDEYEHKEEHLEHCSHYSQTTYICYGTGDFVYMYVPEYLEQNVKIFINGVRVELNYSPDFTSNINPAGRFEDGEKYETAMCVDKCQYPFDKNADFFYTFDYATFQTVMNELSRNQLEITSGFSESRITGRISIPEERSVLFTSIPYDETWQIYVDTEKQTQSVLAVEALTALELSVGEHEIVFEYRSKELMIGAGITLTGLAIFAGIIVLERKKKIKKK